MQSHNFILTSADTDSIAICKQEMTPISKQERKDLLTELNSLMPERISFEDDGYFSCLICIKAKNYILQSEDGSLKIKGAALKAPTKEPALREFIKEIINHLLENKQDSLINLYEKYIKEANNVQDMSRWAFKKTISESVLSPERTNERKVLDALAGTEFSEGDKRYFYFKEDTKLGLLESFDGNYDKYKLMEKIWKTIMIFQTVIDGKQFIKYHLKTKRKLLEELK